MILKTIPMKPFGKARPRVTRNGTFMPKDYERNRAQLAMLFGPVEVEGNIEIIISARRKIPKRTKHQPGDYCTAGPDTDNIAGAVMDSLFPDDDSRVVSMACEKMWDKEDKLVIMIDNPENYFERQRVDFILGL